MSGGRLRKPSAAFGLAALSLCSACSVINKFDEVAPAATGGSTSSGGASGKGGASNTGGTSGSSSGGTSASGTGGESGAADGGTSGTAGDTATGGNAGTAGTDPCTTTYYRDSDRDTYGDDDTTRVACSAPSGYVDRGGDCDDTDADRNPGATEICNGLDENCNDPDEGTTCPPGCVPQTIDSTLHLLCAGPLPWGMARATCEMEGMVLARVRGSTDSLQIRNAMSTTHMAPEYWLGGTDGPTMAMEGTWRWLAGDVIFYPDTALYNNWAPGEPIMTYPSQDCLKAVMGQWHAEECNLTFPFVCEEAP